MDVEGLKRLMEEADEEAKRNSVDGIIGRVTRFENVRIGESHYVVVDVAFEDYLRTQVRRGEYLAIRSIVPKVTIVGIVDAITRSDMLASLKIREVNNVKDPTTLMTPTTIQLTPIREIDREGNARPAVSPIDPQSPVFRPRPELLEKALGIPETGLVIGHVYSGGAETEARVKLDEFALVHHVLLIGTTGSGKTTLLKRIASANEIDKRVVAFDRQGDFVRLAMEKMREAVVIMPVTTLMEGIEVEDYVNYFQERYGEGKVVGIEDGYVVLQYGDSRIYLVPYSIPFGRVMEGFHNMTPYMSPGASMAWESLMRKTKFNIIDGLKGMLEDNSNEKAVEVYETSVKPRLSIDNLTGEPVVINVNELPPLKKTKSTQIVSIEGDRVKINVGKAFDSAMNYLNLADQTRDAIHRVLKSYREFGIFDVPGTFKRVREDLWKKDVIVDLSWVLDYTASVEALATISYHLLSNFFAYKDRLYKEKAENPLSLLIMDEAHEYFPQSQHESVKGVVEGLINKLMRLGRVRRIGVILATHNPDDLNELIIQLSNTKVIMRNDYLVLKKMNADDYADILVSADPGVGLIRSMKFTDVLFKSIVP